RRGVLPFAGGARRALDRERDAAERIGALAGAFVHLVRPVTRGTDVLRGNRQRLPQLGLEHLRRRDALLLPRRDLLEALLLVRRVVAGRRRDVELQVRDAEVVVLLAAVDGLHLQLDGLERAGRLVDGDLLPVGLVGQRDVDGLLRRQQRHGQLLGARVRLPQPRRLLIAVADLHAQLRRALHRRA